MQFSEMLKEFQDNSNARADAQDRRNAECERRAEECERGNAKRDGQIQELEKQVSDMRAMQEARGVRRGRTTMLADPKDAAE